MNLNTALVFVRDIASAKGFYADALGLRIKADGSSHGFCVFDAGSSTLVVEAIPGDAPQEEFDLVGRFTGLSFAVSSANAAYEDLRSRGATFTGAPEKQFWGGTPRYSSGSVRQGAANLRAAISLTRCSTLR